MAGPGSRSAAALSIVGTVGKVLAALLGAGAIAAIAGKGELAGVFAVVGATGAAAGVLADRLERRVERRAEKTRAAADAEGERLSRLATTVPGRRDEVPRVSELSAYDLGADPEAITPEVLDDDAPRPYLPRDRDADLRDALIAARGSDTCSMVVLHGPSKAGKSRSLFQAVNADEALREVAVLVPKDANALEHLLGPGGLPALSAACVVVWLDDLERFVTPTRSGIGRGALDVMAAWPWPVVVVATAGGRGADELSSSGLAVPIDEVYSDPRVRKVPLLSELSERERRRVHERYQPDVAGEVVAHGIGEYLVAAHALAFKLGEERHKAGDDVCPDGAAVAWAAIDWARVGMSGPISRHRLQELWPHYLRGREATDERFQRGLDWALEPVYRSIALIAGTASYRPYDWIVAYADGQLERAIDPVAWDRVLEAADPDAAFDLGVAAYIKRSWPRAARAFSHAAQSIDPYVAAAAPLNLGFLLHLQGDVAGARAAYQQAIDSGHADAAPMAVGNLGVLLQQQQGDVAGARAAFQQAIASGHADAAPKAARNLGMLLQQQGDVAGARATFQQAIDSGHADQAPKAAVNLGVLLHEQGDVAGARAAYQQAIDSGHTDQAPMAARSLGILLQQQGDVAGARATFQQAIDSGHTDEAPKAAVNLGVLLHEQGDVAGARAAYQHAIDSGHTDQAPTAAVNLGALLTEQGDVAAARAAYQQAIDSGHPDAGTVARAALRDLGP